MLLIRQFGNDTECADLPEAIEMLKKKYAGTGVALHWKKPSGITAVTYVDVQEEGGLINTYSREAFDLSMIFGE